MLGHKQVRTQGKHPCKVQILARRIIFVKGEKMDLDEVENG